MGDRFHRSEFHRNSHVLLRRPGIGHNQGPPLEGFGRLVLWRKASEKAWKAPSREVALMRLRRAEQLGLEYRDYAGVMLDRGRSLSLLATTLPALGPVSPRISNLDFSGGQNRWALDALAGEKIGALKNCEILVLADRTRHRRWLRNAADTKAMINDALGGKLTRLVEIDTGSDFARSLESFSGALREMGRAPGEAFMVGTDWDDVGLAEAAQLPLFKWSWQYFAAPPAKIELLPQT
jgi:hypothetical protein